GAGRPRNDHRRRLALVSCAPAWLRVAATGGRSRWGLLAAIGRSRSPRAGVFEAWRRVSLVELGASPMPNYRIAYLIMAHNEPGHLARLVNALDHPGAGFFVHVDA